MSASAGGEAVRTGLTLAACGAGGYLVGRAGFHVPAGHKAVIYNSTEDKVADGPPLEPGFHVRVPFVEDPWVYNMQPVERTVRSACRTRDNRAFECVLECEVSLREDRLHKYQGVGRDEYFDRVVPTLGRVAMHFAAQNYSLAELSEPAMDISTTDDGEAEGGLGSWLASFGFTGSKKKQQDATYGRLSHMDKRRQLIKQAALKFDELAEKFDLQLHGPVYLPSLEMDGPVGEVTEGVSQILLSGAADDLPTDKGELKEMLSGAALRLGLKLDDDATDEDDGWHDRMASSSGRQE